MTLLLKRILTFMRMPLLKAIVILHVLTSCGPAESAEQDYPPAKYVSLPFSFGEVMEVQEADGLCPIRISFGSDCCGIDHELRSVFDDYLADEARVTTIYTQGWGREAEIDYCLDVPEEEDLEPVLRAVQSLLNRYGEPKRGYAHITRSVK